MRHKVDVGGGNSAIFSNNCRCIAIFKKAIPSLGGNRRDQELPWALFVTWDIGCQTLIFRTEIPDRLQTGRRQELGFVLDALLSFFNRFPEMCHCRHVR
jgi:hypothetical protein